MVLLVTDPYRLLTHSAASLLRDVGWILIRVDPVYGKPSATHYLAQNRYTHTAQFTKLILWTYEDYEQILYLDADMLVVRDVVSEIAPYNFTAQTLGVTRSGDGFYMINAGMLLITPSKAVYDSMIEATMTMAYDVEYQEQAFLNAYWSGTDRAVWLPMTVNEYVTNVTADTVVLHFLGDDKPWKICPDPIVHTWACNEWNSYDSS
jgi:lipopolysaccharide biosynthesis glycosyltransferase